MFYLFIYLFILVNKTKHPVWAMTCPTYPVPLRLTSTHTETQNLMQVCSPERETVREHCDSMRVCVSVVFCHVLICAPVCVSLRVGAFVSVCVCYSVLI